MKSARLPGKTLKKVAGKPLLEWLIDRISPSKMVEDIIVATTVSPEDDIIEKFCKKKDIDYYRGSSTDVLGRVYETILKSKADATLRIGPDNPYIDHFLIDQFCKVYLLKKPDYVNNFEIPTYPWGINMDLLSKKLLERLNMEVTEPYDREHISPYILRNRNRFKVISLKLNGENFSTYRLTIDYPQDLLLAEKILHHFKDVEFTFRDIVKFMDENPPFKEINKQYLPKVKINIGD